MTTVEFYRLAGGLEQALALTCNIIEEAFQARLDVLVRVSDDHSHEAIERYLTGFCDLALLPCSCLLEAGRQITVSRADDPGHHHGLLINFCSSIPGWHGRFEKLAEIIYDGDSSLEVRRNHFRFFRDRGYPLRFQHIDAVARSLTRPQPA